LSSRNRRSLRLSGLLSAVSGRFQLAAALGEDLLVPTGQFV
jgi:hypothetical protein